MKTIIAIVGPSGCGKTTMANHLRHCFGIPFVVSSTNRPKRDDEIHGWDHYFYSDEDLSIVMPDKKDMLAYTKFGGYHYWASVAQVEANDYTSYVIDEKGLIQLIEQFNERFNIVPILIKQKSEILKSRISPDRLKRDRGRVTIEDSFYAAIIENNGSLDEFYKNIETTIKKLL